MMITVAFHDREHGKLQEMPQAMSKMTNKPIEYVPPANTGEVRMLLCVHTCTDAYGLQDTYTLMKFFDLSDAYGLVRATLDGKDDDEVHVCVRACACVRK